METNLIPNREKYWSEITDVERIARLRKVLKLMMTQVKSLSSQVNVLRERSELHGHNHLGAPVMPVHRPDQWNQESDIQRDQGKGDDVYI